MDFIGPFPESQGCNYLWVIVCHLTSRVHVVPIKTTTTATELSWLFVKEIVRLHGLPKSIVSDRDSKFTSRWWREVHRLLGAKLLMSTLFHPETDGTTEQVNHSIGQILRSTVNADQRNWVEKCPMLEFAINSSINESTGFAPFELDGGYMPSMIREYTANNISPGVQECNTPRLRGQEVDGASAQTERYRGSWTPAKSLQIPPDVNTTQSIE